MLEHYLTGALQDIETLRELTLQDISDIKEAKHESLFSRSKTKEEVVSSFETKKAIIDNEISKLVKVNQGASLDAILDEVSSTLLDRLRESLKNLKELNKRYARMVLAVSEFYNSLLDRLLPSESNGYDQRLRNSSFLQVRA